MLTNVKKEERKALRSGVAPSRIRLANSESSMPTKAAPNRPVIASQIRTAGFFFSYLAIIAKP